MRGSLRLLGAGMTTMLLIPSIGFSTQREEPSDVAATIERGVLIVRHQNPAADGHGRSERHAAPKDAVPASQDKSLSAESTDDPGLVVRRKLTAAREENLRDAAAPTDRAQQATPFAIDAVPSNPPAWTSVRTSQYDRTNRAWSLHTNSSWSYHPHSLSYHRKRYQGFQPRRSWTYQPVHRQKYRPKSDWTYHRQ